MNLIQVKLIVQVAIISCLFALSCTGNTKKTSNNMEKEFEMGTFGYDLNYLSKKDSMIVLKSDDGKAQIILSAGYQAKVFTSTADGVDGKSLGYVNYKFFDAGVVDEHMNGFGGENRFWLGPEGGQYSVYFEPDAEQVYDNWHTPKAIDIEPWNLQSSSTKVAHLTKEIETLNYKGTTLNMLVDRKISLLSNSEISSALDIQLAEGVKAVAYSTDNKITNKNNFEWTNQTGTVCIWILDMFNPSDSAVTIVPFNQGSEAELGKIATTDYFGVIPEDYLKYDEDELYLKTDGKHRSKIGMNAKRTNAVAGNYDPINKKLTIITFDIDKDAIYLNQEWNPKRDPLKGDALNAYNDGPLEDGSIMGPFLELESCSPGAFLKPGESLSHNHNVYHFTGNEVALSPICEKILGVDLEKVKNVF